MDIISIIVHEFFYTKIKQVQAGIINSFKSPYVLLTSCRHGPIASAPPHSNRFCANPDLDTPCSLHFPSPIHPAAHAKPLTLERNPPDQRIEAVPGCSSSNSKPLRSTSDPDRKKHFPIAFRSPLCRYFNCPFLAAPWCSNPRHRAAGGPTRLDPFVLRV